jgi:hypothetical protein
MEDILATARDRFFAHDQFLLSTKAHERTVTHRIAVYLEQLLPGWHVDCEYNRQGVLPDPKSDGDGNRVFPDVIVHVRGRKRNLLVLEAKPVWAPEEEKLADRDKLLRILQVHPYRHAYLLHYSAGDDATLTFERVALPTTKRRLRSNSFFSTPLPLP